ncbi:MAG: TetR/AcrR family transcriptional regulator [Actinobacteria bacterium]|nr:TetR/AcrR family transcriptional regulator [Actinomycetota bacterium]
MPPRKITRDAVVTAAIDLADREGIEGLSMRAVAKLLGVEAMSLYHHVASKDALLDAMVDRVYSQIEAPAADGDWRDNLRLRSESARTALRRHAWALPLMESRRTPGPATLAYHDANVACLRAAGFSPELVAHAYAVVDAFVYGFVLQEATLPFGSGDEAADMVRSGPMADGLADYPNMAWFAEQVGLVPGYSFDREFGPGLELVLDGIEARHTGRIEPPRQGEV